MTEPNLLGQGDACARLFRQARARRMHHGVLITGPRGVGKTLVARRLTQALLCSGEDPDGPCGICSDCKRLDNHPDQHVLTLPEDKDEIPVDLVRDLLDSLARLPVEGRARVVRIDPADRLNAQGQNALLKTLEEPGHDTYLLMTTRRPEGLLDTVRSRVAELRVLPLADEVLRERLTGEFSTAAEADLEDAVALASGCMGQAQVLLAEENLPILHLVRGYLESGMGTPVTVAKAALEGASGRLPALERARMTLWMARALLAKELRASLAKGATGPYPGGTSVRWTAAIESLIDAETDLNLRIPPEQVLVDVFFHISPQNV